RHTKPEHLPPGRLDRELERGAFAVPDASRVPGGHTETIAAWAKIRVEDLASIARVLPLRVPSLQLVAKLRTFRQGEAEPGVLDLQVVLKGRQPKARSRSVALA